MSQHPWMKTAESYIGIKEFPGVAKNNPTIMGWAKRLGGWIASFYKNDEIPWCGLFVAECFNAHKMQVPASALSALAWANWGQPSKLAPGAVLVFKRQGGGHVGFYVAEDSDSYHVLGGNQSNSVSVTRIAKDRLVAIRWPKESHPPASEQRVMRRSFSALSRNEA